MLGVVYCLKFGFFVLGEGLVNIVKSFVVFFCFVLGVVVKEKIVGYWKWRRENLLKGVEIFLFGRWGDYIMKIWFWFLF